MARKSNKIEYKDVSLSIKDGKVFVHEIEDDTQEERIKDLDKVTYGLYEDIGKLNMDLIIKKHSTRTATERKPIVKLKCPKCGAEVKTDVTDIKIICKKCDKEFVIEE